MLKSFHFKPHYEFNYGPSDGEVTSPITSSMEILCLAAAR